MARKPAQSRPAQPAKPVKRPRGRPPRPGGRKPAAEVQRAYRARLAAAGKVVTIVDRDVLADQTMFAGLREKLHDALLKLALRDEEVARLTARNHHLENELKRVERHNLDILKELIEFRKAAVPAVRGRSRSKSRAK